LALAWLRTLALLNLSPAVSKTLGDWISSKAWVQAEWEVGEYARCERQLCRFQGRLLGYFDGKVFHPLAIGIQVKATGEGLPVIPGEVYRAPLRFSDPKGFRNPESFDYPRYLRRQGIFAVAQAGSPEGWIRLRPASYFYRKAAAWGRFLHAELAELPNRPER